MKPRYKHVVDPVPDFATRQELATKYIEAEEQKSEDGLEPIKFRNVVALGATGLAVMVAVQNILIKYVDNR